MRKIPFIILFITIFFPKIFYHQEQAQLLINEVFSSPPTGEEEWLEIYNPTDQAIPLVGWQIAENISSTIKNHELINKNQEATISAQGFWLVETTKVTLNNSGDTIYLLSPTGQIIDFITYPKLSNVQSYHRVIDGGSQWDYAQPSKGRSNHLINYQEEESAVVTVTSTSDLPNPLPLNLAPSLPTKLNSSTQVNLPSTKSSSIPISVDTQNIEGSLATQGQSSWKKDFNFRLPKINYQGEPPLLIEEKIPVIQNHEATTSNILKKTNASHSQSIFLALAVIIISSIIILSLDFLQWWYDNQKINAETVVDF